MSGRSRPCCTRSQVLPGWVPEPCPGLLNWLMLYWCVVGSVVFITQAVEDLKDYPGYGPGDGGTHLIYT